MYYFAFASNLSRKQMAERAPQARARFSAVLPNYKLVFAGWSRSWNGAVASIRQSRGDRVLGGVYELSEQDMEKLARYEGDGYSVTRVVVFPDTGAALEAVTLVQKGQKDEGKPSPEYLAVIKQGYNDWGLI